MVALFDENVAYQLCRAWAFLNLFLFRIEIHARRRAPVDPDATYVFMSNHQSQLDILAVMAALPEFQMRCVAKRELTGMPIFGWARHKFGQIMVERQCAATVVSQLED